MKFDKLDFNIWKDFEENSSEVSPFDLLAWKKIWSQNLGANFDYKIFFNSNFFIPIKFSNLEASLIGDKDVVDYNAILYKNNKFEDFNELIDQIFEEKISNFRIYSIVENSEILKNLKMLKDYNINISEEDVAPYLSLPQSWDEYLVGLSKKRRHEIKRKIRRFEENFSYISGDYDSIENVKEITDEFIRLHKLSSNEKELFMNENREIFFRNLIYKFLLDKKLLYSYIKVNNATIACSISFVLNGTRYLYNSGFDPGYIKHSSGLLNHVFAIKRSIENKFQIFDFMRGNERYKYDLGGIDKKLYSINLERK